jgi:hypothetical protein
MQEAPATPDARTARPFRLVRGRAKGQEGDSVPLSYDTEEAYRGALGRWRSLMPEETSAREEAEREW